MGLIGQPTDNVLLGKLNDLIAWGRKYSLWPTPFATA